MGMWTTDNQDTMRIVLKAFIDASHKNYNSHSYAAGYLESMVVQMLPFMPKRVQKSFVEDIIRAVQKNEAQIIAKTNKEAA